MIAVLYDLDQCRRCRHRAAADSRSWPGAGLISAGVEIQLSCIAWAAAWLRMWGAW